MTTSSDIRNKIFKDNITRRIVIKVSTKALNPEDYRTSSYDIASQVFPDWPSNPQILVLAIDVWSKRTFIVIDINNSAYDFHTAHKTTTPFPVYVLREDKRKQGCWALVRWHAEDELLSKRLADLHNFSGFDVTPPLLEDHTSRIVHESPRWLKQD
ncbi:hypothetical protein N7516_000459 [Penicillium verrucosum]|uniref:uncharacterized protein n=1 Tax=Penicillium verrucosum TaxID=60171 RepID=UPI002544F5EB|nr:uncharacterized protein N7516_000459 [Penicillium verrucosum]KAJ5940291.1 hypothetical protein N7516_000459 [Penicillium verrucosum]